MNEFNFENRLWVIQDVSDFTQFSISTIRKHVLNNTIPFHRVNGRIRFFPQEIMFWISHNGQMPPKAADSSCKRKVLVGN